MNPTKMLHVLVNLIWPILQVLFKKRLKMIEKTCPTKLHMAQND
jgi:hypothetical protein